MLRIRNLQTDLPILNEWSEKTDVKISTLTNRIEQIAQQATTTQDKVTATVAVTEASDPAASISITQSSKKVDVTVYAVLTVTYTAPSPLGTFAGVYLVLTGYQGNSAPVKVGEDNYLGVAGGSQTFAVVLARTGETVKCYIPAKNASEVATTPWDAGSYVSITLNGTGTTVSLDDLNDGSTRFAAAEAGADVTANHTSADTSAVNGVAAGTVSTGVGRANSAIDSGNLIVAGSIDFSRSYLNKTLDYVPNGTARFGVGYIDSNNRALIDFSQGGHLNKTLDNVDDGSNFIRQQLITGQALVVPNPNFANGVSGWSGSATVTQASSSPFTNGKSMKLTASAQYAQATQSTEYKVSPGDVIHFGAYLLSDGTFSVYGQLIAYDGSGNSLGQFGSSLGVTTTTTWQFFSLDATAPSNAAYFFVRFTRADAHGGSQSAWVTDIQLTRKASLDNEVADGSSYVRTTPNEKTGAGRGYNALDSNSRLAGPFYNNPVNTNAKAVTSLSNNGTTTVITVGGGTLYQSFGNITYSSGSVDPGSYGTWYVYADDPTFSGGAVTYHATNSLDTLYLNSGRICFGKITTKSGGNSLGAIGGTGAGVLIQQL